MRVEEKGVQVNKNNFCYISPNCPESPVDEFVPDFGRNQLRRIICRSVQGYRFCEWLKFAYSHSHRN